LTNPTAHYALGSGFQLARAFGPLGWNDEKEYSVIDDETAPEKALFSSFADPRGLFPHPTPHSPPPTPFVIPDERRQPRDLGSRPSHQPVMTVLQIDLVDRSTGRKPGRFVKTATF